MKIEATNELYYQFEDMLNKHAWGVAKQYGMEFDDCKRECNAIFLHALKSFNASLSGFSTHLTNCLKTRLINFTKASMDSHTVPIDTVSASALIKSQPDNFLNKVKELSKEAQELVDLIVHGPAELIDHPPTPTAIRREIKSHLINDQDWKPYHVRKVFHEIRLLLRRNQPKNA